MAERPTYEELVKRIQVLEKSESRRKLAEHALKASEAYLSTLIRTTPDLVWFKDPQGIYLFCNSRFESFFGAEEKEIVGKTDYNFVDKELADFFRMHDNNAIAKGKSCKNEEKIIFAADGHTEFLETIRTPIFKEDGELLGVLGIGRDITNRKRAESERLANLHFFESLDRVNLALHSTNDLEQVLRVVLDLVFSLFDCDRVFLLHPCDPDTDAWEIPMERTRPEYPGAFKQGTAVPATQQIKELFASLLGSHTPLALTLGEELDPEDEPWKQFSIQSVLASALYPKIGKPWCFGLQQCSYTRQWTSREKTLFREISRRIADSLTNLLMYRDLEKMVDERTTQLQAAQEELVKKEKLSVLGQLTTIVSHELRNPLGVIRTSNYYLQQRIKGPDEKIEKHLKRIDTQISHCDAIIADLLEYTRGRNIEVVAKDVTPWLTQVVNQMKEHTDVEIALHIASNLPHVAHDQEKMTRVIINLLTNAIQAVQTRVENNEDKEIPLLYTPRVWVDVQAVGEGLSIKINDNGTGMTSEIQRRAFEPLFTTRFRGTGIGLAIVKKTIDEHNGDICVDSRVDEGTQITITLPLCVPEGL